MASLTSLPLQIWTVELQRSSAEVRRARELLSPAELRRADELLSQRASDQMILTRAALRTVLADELGVEPQDVRLTEGLFGKPRLEDRRELKFSLSHSGRLAVIALGSAWTLGVDVEQQPSDTRRSMAVIERFCAPEEVAAVHALRPAALAQGLTCLWSRKEAYLKALGVGLRVPLSSFAVNATGTPRVLRGVPGDPLPPSSWSMSELTLPGGSCGTLVAAGLALPESIRPARLPARS